jgi:WD40 repeat protein
VGEELIGHQGWIYRVAWNANRIVSASEDGTARVWNSDSGKLISIIPGPQGWWVYSAEISGDGNRVAIASENGTAFIYGTEFLSSIDELKCETRLRRFTDFERLAYLYGEKPLPHDDRCEDK